MKKIILGLFILIVLLGCSEDGSTGPDLDPEDYLYQGIAVVKTNDSDFEYIANDPEGNMVLYDWSSGHVTKAVCRDKNGNWVQMDFDNQGYPSFVYSENYIVIIDNIANGTADFAVIEVSSGDINVFRNVNFNIGRYERGWYGDVAEGLRYASIALGSFTLAATVIGVIPGGQASIALAAVGLILTVITDVAADHFEALETSSLAFNIGAGAIGCSGNLLECVGLGITISAEVLDIIDENQEEIQSAQGILIGGYGDIQITLTWDNTADLDLYVTDPWNETICYYNSTSASGGWLDFDDMNGYGPENVFWENNTAPSGYYEVELDYYSGNSGSNYIVTVSIGNEVETYSGFIGVGEYIGICSFYYSSDRGFSFQELSNRKLVTNRQLK